MLLSSELAFQRGTGDAVHTGTLQALIIMVEKNAFKEQQNTRKAHTASFFDREYREHGICPPLIVAST